MPGKRNISTGIIRRKISTLVAGLSLILTLVKNNYEFKNR